MDDYRPTSQLRFVERSVPAPEMGENIGRTVRILQQLWASIYVGEQPEWRDIPLEKENGR